MLRIGRLASLGSQATILSSYSGKCYCTSLRVCFATSWTQQLQSSSRSLCTSPSLVGFTNYEEECANFKVVAPEYYNFASDVIDKWAVREQRGERGDNPAFWWLDDSGNEIKWTFQDLAQLSRKATNVLDGCGLRTGGTVLCVLPKLPQWWLINIACIRMGAILSSGTTLLTSNDLRSRLQKSKAACIVVNEDIVPKVEQILSECPLVKSKIVVGTKNTRPGWFNFDDLLSNASPECETVKTKSSDPMTIFFTSGTTGHPKMSEHTHASYGLAHVITGKYWLDLVPSDVMWSLADPGWAKAAYSSLFGPWIQGSCVFIQHTASPKFEVETALQLIDKYPVTTFCAPPTVYRMMVLCDLTKYRFKALRHCVSAGEPLNPEVIEMWQQRTGHIIREGYGQTETTLLVAAFQCVKVKPGSMGKPAPGYDVRVIDENGAETKDGVEGDIAVRVRPHRPVGLFSRYVGEPEKTASTIRGDFYLTGDRAVRDEDGYLWFVGRDDDVIISAGYRIGPFEVESALIEHPAVAESAVVSSPDAVRGEIVKAFVILAPPFESVDKDELSAELQEHVKTITAPYKYPRKIEFVKELPKTVSGKIRRVELRLNEWSHEENKA